jgi:hypothetical protein
LKPSSLAEEDKLEDELVWTMVQKLISPDLDETGNEDIEASRIFDKADATVKVFPHPMETGMKSTATNAWLAFLDDFSNATCSDAIAKFVIHSESSADFLQKNHFTPKYELRPPNEHRTEIEPDIEGTGDDKEADQDRDARRKMLRQQRRKKARMVRSQRVRKYYDESTEEGKQMQFVMLAMVIFAVFISITEALDPNLERYTAHTHRVVVCLAAYSRAPPSRPSASSTHHPLPRPPLVTPFCHQACRTGDRHDLRRHRLRPRGDGADVCVGPRLGRRAIP